MSYDDSGSWDGSFYLNGQYNPIALARWIQTYDPDTFTSFGGDNSQFTNTGQVTGPTEIAQLTNLRLVAGNMIADTSRVYQWEKDHQFGFQSPNDPNYFKPYWTQDIDRGTCLEQLSNGSGVGDWIACLKYYGYTDSEIQDALCLWTDDYFTQISLPSGIGSNKVLAEILGVPQATRFLDPVVYITPVFTPEQIQQILTEDASAATWVNTPPGTLSPDITEWAYHLGGEHVNFSFPLATNNYIEIVSIMNLTLQFYVSDQADAVFYNAAANYIKRFKDLVAFGKKLSLYCVNESTTWNINYNLLDLISQIPVTPAQKKWMSNSTHYNKLNMQPPTLTAAIILTLFDNVCPVVLATDPNAEPPITPEGGTPSLYSRNKVFWPMCLNRWAKLVHAYIAADQGLGRPMMEQVTLLKPFADLYDPQ